MSNSVGEDFRAWLIDQPRVYELVGHRIHQDWVPSVETFKSEDAPYIWFSRSGVIRLDCIGDVVGDTGNGEGYNLELIAKSQRECRRLENAVMELHNYKGDMGDSVAQAIWLEDQSDDYVPQGVGDVDGLAVIALSVEVVLLT